MPDRDGGFTISVLRRALDMAAAGAEPLLLTIDPGESADHDADRAEWVRRGLLADPAGLRNLFDDARADPSWLREAALSAPHPGDRLAVPRDHRCRRAGPCSNFPSSAATRHGTSPMHPCACGATTARSAGFPVTAGLYRAWVNAVAARSDKPVVLVCEARQVGEALVAPGEPALDPGIRILHTTHACHVLAPFAWDSPMDAAWQRWFGVADRFDGVLWLTGDAAAGCRAPRGGRHPLVRRSAPGARAVWFEARLARARADRHAQFADPAQARRRCDPRARRAARTRPEAHLHVYGDGAQRAELEALAASSGLSRRRRPRRDTPPTPRRRGPRRTSSSSRARTRASPWSCSRRSPRVFRS